MIYIRLFFEFMKVGAFAIGGGLATLPFLYNMSEATGWFTEQDIADMVAVSESTPGPIGINMASYVGYKVGYDTGSLPGAILGTIIAVLGIITPSIIIILVIAYFLEKFKNNSLVKKTMYGLHPASIALISAACILLFKDTLLNLGGKIDLSTLFNIKGIILAVIIFGIMSLKKKFHPVVYIAFSAVVGIIFNFSK